MVRSRSILGVALFSAGALVSAQVGGQRWLPQNQVSWSTMQTGMTSKIQSQTVQTLSTENDFQAYWKAATGQPAQTAPKSVDWLKEKLVAIHIGSRPSGGYSLAVTGIDRSGNMAIVHALEHTPTKGQWVSDMMTSPWVIVRVPKDLGQVRLDLTQKEGQSVGGVTIYTPGGAVIHPDNYNRIGGGSIDPKNSVSWGTIKTGVDSYGTASGVYTCNNSAEWQQSWYRLTGASGATAPGSVDWTKEKVVILTLGERPSTGFALRVLGVEKNGQYGIIRAVEETPLAGSWGTKRATHPYAIVRVPRELSNFSVDLTQREGDGNTRIVDGG